jgi:hypothetical protein
VTYGEFKATVNIRTLCINEGELPRRATELVLDWAELHQAELLADGIYAKPTSILIRLIL